MSEFTIQNITARGKHQNSEQKRQGNIITVRKNVEIWRNTERFLWQPTNNYQWNSKAIVHWRNIERFPRTLTDINRTLKLRWRNKILEQNWSQHQNICIIIMWRWSNNSVSQRKDSFVYIQDRQPFNDESILKATGKLNQFITNVLK